MSYDLTQLTQPTMILFIDTTENLTTIALGEGGKLIDLYTWDADMAQSEQLLPEIDKLLAKNKVKLKDLKGIIVVCGPGSYTGLRVGISTANSLAFGLGIPIVGVRKKGMRNNLSRGTCPEWSRRKSREELGISDVKGKKYIEGLIKEGERLLKEAKPGEFVVPTYPAPPKITWPKKK